MKRFLTLLAVATAVVTSCAKESDSAEKGGGEGGGGRQFVASVDTIDSKIYLDECKVRWNKGDQISVFDAAGKNFKFVARNEGATAVFEQSGDTPGTLSGSEFYALYPYSAGASLNGSEISCSTPLEYSAKPGSFSNSASSLMTARTVSDQLRFKNVSALLRLEIPSGVGVSELWLCGKGTDLAGGVRLNVDPDGVSSITGAPAEGKGVTISPAEGSTFAAGVYYLPVLPAGYSSLRMKITYCSGTDNVSDAFSLDELKAERNKVISLGTVYDGRDWFRWLNFENGVATCPYLVEGNPGSLSAVDNPYRTSSNSSSKVLKDSKPAGSTSAYFTIYVKDIDEAVRGRMKAVKYQIYLGKNEYYPRLVYNGGMKYMPASINGIKPSGSKWTEAEWAAAVRTDDWNTFCHPISQFTDASGWKSSASYLEIRPLSNFSGGNITDETISPANTRTVYIDNIGFTYTEVPEVRPADKGYVKVKAKEKPGSSWSEYNSLIVDNLGYVPVPARLNRFGGWVDGPSLASTGYYHTQKYNGRWVIVDPDGKMNLICAVNSVSPGGGEDQKAAYKSKYGTDKSAWFAQTADLLWGSGFTGVGAWSDWDAVRQYNASHPERQISYSPNMDLMADYESSKGKTLTNKLIYVFDPEFVSWCEKKIPAFVATFKGDPNVMGYFSDNELPILVGSLKNYLTLPASDYGRKAAEAWMAGKGITEEQITDAVGREFAGYVAEKYYGIVVPLLRASDPEHMYLGMRYSGTTKTIEGAYKAAGKWCDVISMNYYGYWELRDADIQKWASWTDTPFIITEFYTKGEDSGLPNNTGDGWIVPTQMDRAWHYENFVIKLLRTPQCVGWHWFKYQDNDPTALHPSASNIDSNKGIIDNSYDAYEVLVERMIMINEIRYGLL